MALSLKAILGIDTVGYEAGINRATKKAQDFEKKLSSSAMAGLGRWLSAAATLAFTKSVVDLGSSISDLSKRTETSTDAIQQWIYAAKQSGSDANTVVAFFERLGDARASALEGNEAMINSFSRLGISMRDLRTMRAEDIGLKIGNAVKQGDAQQLIGALRDVGGKGAGQLVTAFKNGLEPLFADAPLLDAKQIIDLDAVGDEIDKLVLRIKIAFAPLIGWVSKLAQDMIAVVELLVRGTSATIKGMMPGGMSKAEAGKEFGDWYEKMIDEHAARWKEKGPSETLPVASFSGSSNKKKERFQDSMKEPGLSESLKSSTRTGSQINELQKIGAYVGFDPMRSEIQNLTMELRRVNGNLNYLKNRRIPGMGLTTNGGVQF